MKKRIIAIERQYASGGKAIGELTGKILGLPVHADDIFEIAAERLGTDVEKLHFIEENATNSLLYSLAFAVRTNETKHDSMSPEQRLFTAESEIINEIAEREECIFVGRCAALILAQRQDCMKVFVYADEEFRGKNATENYGVPVDKTVTQLKKQDRRRGNFYNMNSDIRWDDRDAYDLMIDSSRLGFEDASKILAAAYKSLSE